MDHPREGKSLVNLSFSCQIAEFNLHVTHECTQHTQYTHKHNTQYTIHIHTITHLYTQVFDTIFHDRPDRPNDEDLTGGGEITEEELARYFETWLAILLVFD